MALFSLIGPAGRIGSRLWIVWGRHVQKWGTTARWRLLALLCRGERCFLRIRRRWAELALVLHRAPVQRRLLLLSAYLLLLLLTEGLATAAADWLPAVGLACYGLLALVLVGHAVLSWGGAGREIPLLVAFSPVLRLLLLSRGPAGRASPWPILALALPSLCALGMALHALGLVRPSAWARSAVLAGFLVAVLLLAWASGPAMAVTALGEARSGLAAMGRAAAAYAPRGGSTLSAGGRGRPARLPVVLDRAGHLAAGAMHRSLGPGLSWPPGPAGTERLLPPYTGGVARPQESVLSVPARPELWPYVPLGAALSTPAEASPPDSLLLPRPTPAADGIYTETEAAPALPPPLPPGCPALGYENIYPRGVCTWYAKERRPDLPSFAWDYGLAMYWSQAARLCGFRVDKEPAVGAVIVFPPGANGADVGGHVGYVEEVGADSLLISECNVSPGYPCYEEPMYWVGGYFCANRRIGFAWLDAGVRFIHGRE